MISTRDESIKQVNKARRYMQILDTLKEYPDGLSAKEIADILGYQERNSTAPRLTELDKKHHKVMVIGKRYDFKTNRNVSIYKRCKPEEWKEVK